MVDEKMSNVWDDFKQNHMEDVKMFMEKNKTRPSSGAKDKNEKVLDSWISTQIRNREKGVYSMIDEKIRHVWDDFKQNHDKYFK